MFTWVRTKSGIMTLDFTVITNIKGVSEWECYLAYFTFFIPVYTFRFSVFVVTADGAVFNFTGTR